MDQMLLRAVVGTILAVVLLALAAKRGWFLFSLASSGRPAVGRFTDPTIRVEAEATEVLGQKKLLKWVIPGTAHVFAFWGFLVLGLTVWPLALTADANSRIAAKNPTIF